jgi:hypothetical protein
MFCAKPKPFVIRILADKLHFYQIFIQNMLLFCVEWSSSKTWCDKFVLIFIQNMLLFLCRVIFIQNMMWQICTDLHPKHHVSCRVMVIQNMLFCAECSSSKHVVLCRVIFIQNIQNMLFCAECSSSKTCCFVQCDLHPRHVDLCRVIFIQNMLFCAVWSSSKTWCAVFQSRAWCSYTAIPLTFEEFIVCVLVAWLVYDWFGVCDSGDALLVAHFFLSLSLSRCVSLWFFWVFF